MTQNARCPNFGNCKIADSRRILPLKPGRAAQCPECKTPLHAYVDDRKASQKKVLIASIVGGFLFIGILVGLVFAIKARKQQEAAARVAARQAQASQPPTVSTANPDDYKNTPVALRFSGGASMSPLAGALLKGWVESTGGSEFQKFVIKKFYDEFYVAKVQGNWVRFNVQSQGNDAGFESIKSAQSDITMSNIPISDAQVGALAGLGDMHSPDAEWVVGLDAMAIIVSNSNPVRIVTRQQGVDIFSGKFTNWKDLGGNDAPIEIFSRGEGSSTLDSFKRMVMGAVPVSKNFKRFDDQMEMIKAVGDNPNAVSFANLPFLTVTTVRPLAISDFQSRPLIPNPLTVGAEDYVFTNRLFFYAPPASSNLMVKPFLEFAVSQAGQKIVTQSKFTGQTLENLSNTQGLEDAVFVADTPIEYRKAVEVAQRIPMNFRFKSGKSDLDSKSNRDLQRLVDAMKTNPSFSGKRVLLFGFADNVGGDAKNVELSTARAQELGKRLELLGVKVDMVRGFGSKRPVASNETPDGREKNRRVEVWVSR